MSLHVILAITRRSKSIAVICAYGDPHSRASRQNIFRLLLASTETRGSGHLTLLLNGIDGELMRYRTIGAFAISMTFGAQARAQDANMKAADASKDAASRPATGVDRSQAPNRPPVYGKRDDWFIGPYGYARLDAIEDSTQSFEDGIQPNLIARAVTNQHDHRPPILTAPAPGLAAFA